MVDHTNNLVLSVIFRHLNIRLKGIIIRSPNVIFQRLFRRSVVIVKEMSKDFLTVSKVLLEWLPNEGKLSIISSLDSFKSNDKYLEMLNA
jgi:hypothetical protein